MSTLPRALRVLACELVVTEDEPHPWAVWSVSIRSSHAVLAGPATRVPEGAGRSGIQRTVIVTSRGP
jgi:hypothetical protein